MNSLVFNKDQLCALINFQEFDHPYSLLQNNEGYLYRMVQQTGSNVSAALTSAAKKVKHIWERIRQIFPPNIFC